MTERFLSISIMTSYMLGVLVPVPKMAKWWRHHRKRQNSFNHLLGIVIKVLHAKFEGKQTKQSWDIGVLVPVPKRDQMITSSSQMTKNSSTSRYCCRGPTYQIWMVLNDSVKRYRGHYLSVPKHSQVMTS